MFDFVFFFVVVFAFVCVVRLGGVYHFVFVLDYEIAILVFVFV